VMGVSGQASAAPIPLGQLVWGDVENIASGTPQDYTFTLAENSEVTFEIAPSATIVGEVSSSGGGVVGTGTDFVVALDKDVEYKFRVQKIGAGGQVDFDGSITVSSVPLPAAAWLFGSALLGLVGIARRKRA
jgi:hypothetical protein